MSKWFGSLSFVWCHYRIIHKIWLGCWKTDNSLTIFYFMCCIDKTYLPCPFLCWINYFKKYFFVLRLPSTVFIFWMFQKHSPEPGDSWTDFKFNNDFSWSILSPCENSWLPLYCVLSLYSSVWKSPMEALSYCLQEAAFTQSQLASHSSPGLPSPPQHASVEW